MLVGVLTALAVFGAVALLIVLFLQRGRDGVDLSLGGLLRV
jgi:preprotein translocase subunit SecG